MKHHGRRLTFRAPGDDWYSGRVDHYRASYQVDCRRVRECPGRPRASIKAKAAGGARQVLRLPEGIKRVRIQAVDEAGNVGPPKKIRVHRRGR